VSEAHAAPHAWKLDLHVKPQVVPLQVATVAFRGTGHGLQLVPQALTSVVLGHSCPQACVLAALHVGSQVAAVSMHAPAQSFLPVGQEPSHAPATQVAVPPLSGARQGEQDVPQVWGLSS
jgi:hypothetical protein